MQDATLSAVTAILARWLVVAGNLMTIAKMMMMRTLIWIAVVGIVTSIYPKMSLSKKYKKLI